MDLEPILRRIVDGPPGQVSFEECYRRVYFYCLRRRPSRAERRALFLWSLERTASLLVERLSGEERKKRTREAGVRWNEVVVLVRDVLLYMTRDLCAAEKDRMTDAARALFVARHGVFCALAEKMPIELARGVFAYL